MKVTIKIRESKEVGYISVPVNVEFDQYGSLIVSENVPHVTPVNVELLEREYQKLMMTSSRVSAKKTERRSTYTFYKDVVEESEFDNVNEAINIVINWFKGNYKNQVLSIRKDTTKYLGSFNFNQYNPDEEDETLLADILYAMEKRYGERTIEFKRDYVSPDITIFSFFYKDFEETWIQSVEEGVELLLDYFDND